MYLLGLDIGGTKCAAVTAEWNGEEIRLIEKRILATDCSIAPEDFLSSLFALADGILVKKPDKIGISCGGPLDSSDGIILSPPNLPGWDKVRIVSLAEKHFGAPARLQNDANACAVAEWKFGAGRGYKNLAFLTFGTGLGAGLILDGRLYEGTNGNAGEVGHIRLAEDGPVGYGKRGSFESFCSGGGISQLAYRLAVKSAYAPSYYKEGMNESDVTARAVAEAATKGDPTALEVYRISAEKLGAGLSVLIDILNPEAIIIGSIFTRSESLFRDTMTRIIEKEALKNSVECCKILASELAETIGDYAAIGVAIL